MAKDVEDLHILVAHMQDALLPITAMDYDRKAATFTFLANRHCWEHPPLMHEGANLYHRVHSGICFHNVKAVQHHGFHPKSPLRTLNFLTILPETVADILTLRLIFSGINEIHLQVGEIHCRLMDVEQPWPTRNQPMHVHEHVSTYNSSRVNS
ncbi:MAG: DUF2948 family protein [Alphaproteobacteria bacterium]